jgi:predicted nucleic acid-binding protein
MIAEKIRETLHKVAESGEYNTEIIDLIEKVIEDNKEEIEEIDDLEDLKKILNLKVKSVARFLVSKDNDSLMKWLNNTEEHCYTL